MFPKKKLFLLIYNGSSVSCRTCYIMCLWKIYPQWNCLNPRSSADVGGSVSTEGDLDWCGIWHEGNASLHSVRKLSVKCCHCIKVCMCVCPCIIVCAYMLLSAGGAGHVSSWQKLLQQTETNSWIWASAASVHDFFCCFFFPSTVLPQHGNPYLATSHFIVRLVFKVRAALEGRRKTSLPSWTWQLAAAALFAP